MCVCAQLHLTLCDPMDCSPPGSSVHGILQARTLEWVAISSSTGSSPPNLSWWGRIWSLAPTTFKEYPGLDPALGSLSKGVWLHHGGDTKASMCSLVSPGLISALFPFLCPNALLREGTPALSASQNESSKAPTLITPACLSPPRSV